jgi:hypothetical protein
MARGDQINLKPHFEEERGREGLPLLKLPCEGEAGDLFVFSRLREDQPDPSAQGVAELWFCTKSSQSDGRHAVWKRVSFDGMSRCDDVVDLPLPPQNTPPPPRQG